MFGDSSQDIFIALVFLQDRLVTKGTETAELAFVIGKARVARMKCLTIPKLELQAALLASRLRQEVQRAVSLIIKRCCMWTDSTTVVATMVALA